MPRKLRIQYPGAIYHLMNRGDRREAIFVVCGRRGIPTGIAGAGQGMPEDRHYGEDAQEAIEVKAQRLVRKGLARLRWREEDLTLARKGDERKARLAMELRPTHNDVTGVDSHPSATGHSGLSGLAVSSNTSPKRKSENMKMLLSKMLIGVVFHFTMQ